MAPGTMVMMDWLREEEKSVEQANGFQRCRELPWRHDKTHSRGNGCTWKSGREYKPAHAIEESGEGMWQTQAKARQADQLFVRE